MKAEADLISVIIPVYNVKPYLEECVNSVITQTYKNIEIILVDDGSKDGSGELCDSLKQKDQRIRVIHKMNAGLGFARNSGLEIFTGKYVTFIDSDDYVTASMIETLYSGIKENAVDECKMGFQRVKNDYSVCGETKYIYELFPGDKAKTEYAPRLIGSAPDRHDSIEMCVCGVIFDGDIIREHNLRFPSERELISEDLVFHLEYLQHANGACTIENTDYKYRVNDASLSRSYRPDRFERSLFFYNALVERLKLYGYGMDEINRAKRITFVYLRVCIEQEVLFKKNTVLTAINNIKQICSNEKVEEIIDSYPVNKLGISQKIFVKCIRLKLSAVLYFLKKIGAY